MRSRLAKEGVYVVAADLPEAVTFSERAAESGVLPSFEGGEPGWLVPWGVALAAAEWAEADADAAGTSMTLSLDSEADVALAADRDLLAALLPAIGLPTATTLTLYVKARGAFSQSSFVWAHSWESGGQPVSIAPPFGALLLDNDGNVSRRMRLAQWRVLEVLAAARTPADEDERRRTAARVKAACGDGVRLDSYLEREDLVELDLVAPKLVPLPDGRGFRVDARAPTMPELDLSMKLASGRRGSIRTAVAGGTRRTVLVGERAERGLEVIRRRRQLAASDVPKALTDPLAFFGPDLDTSAFTDRVVGIGVVTSAQPSFAGGLEIGGWFEFKADETARFAPAMLDLATAEQRDAVCAAVREAEADGLAWFKNPFGEGYLQITAALKAVVCPVPEVAKPERRGLMVKSNEEELEVESEQELEFVGRLAPLPQIALAAGVRLGPHQEIGVRWLLTLAGGKSQGALLADDMGLGKTLQLLAFLAALGSQGRTGPHLVVAPVGLLTNWEREAERFFGDMFSDIAVVQGKTSYTNTELEEHRLVLVGFDSLRMNELLFARVRWDVVVLDEAQRIKNVGTHIARVVRALHAHMRIASTGTPVENSLDELWSIFDWAMPGLLGTRRDFGRNFVEPARDASRRGAWHELAGMSTELRKRMGRYFLRRTKAEVLDLEPLVVRAQGVPLSPAQAARYMEIMGQRQQGLPALTALSRLFDVCAHPALGAHADSHLPTGVSFPKADALWRILDEVYAAGEKAIVFAKRIPIQHWLADEIAARFGRRPAIINGEVGSSTERMRIVERFQSAVGSRTLVLGPRAAGVGLNITAANHVIHFTREWNPAVENQATDRAYRIGQTKPVAVHYLIVTGDALGRTVEERLDELLERKRGLMREFVVPLVPVNVEESDFAL